MNWKVGDKIWIDYEKASVYGANIDDWMRWFPPEEQPFTITSITRTVVECDNGYGVSQTAIHNKNYIVTQILNDL